jgi:hypothetical protein
MVYKQVKQMKTGITIPIIEASTMVTKNILIYKY